MRAVAFNVTRSQYVQTNQTSVPAASIAFSLLTGIIYPLVITGIAQVVFPKAGQRQSDLSGWQAGGIVADRPTVYRSKILLEPTVGHVADAVQRRIVGRINLGPTNPDLAKAVQERIAALRKADPGNDAPIPVDLVTSSASGLDPHISPAAAEYQVARVAKARGLDARPCGNWSPGTPKAEHSACWANPE